MDMFLFSGSTVWMVLAMQSSLAVPPPVAVMAETIVVDDLATADEPGKPVPITDPGTWVTSADYPSWAIRYGLDGVVGFTLAVDAQGKVANCTITRSSGASELDRIACEKLRERARFRPAIDGDGSAVAGEWSNKVRWEIPTTQRAPRAGVREFVLTVEEDGTVSECKVIESSGAAATAKAQPCDGDRRYKPIIGENGKPQRTQIVLRTSVEHREPQ